MPNGLVWCPLYHCLRQSGEAVGSNFKIKIGRAPSYGSAEGNGHSVAGVDSRRRSGPTALAAFFVVSLPAY